MNKPIKLLNIKLLWANIIIKDAEELLTKTEIMIYFNSFFIIKTLYGYGCVLVSYFRDYINTKYNLTNPLDPKHRQATQNINPNWRNSPNNASKKDIITNINNNLTALFTQGKLNSRQDVEQALKDNGYTITRNKSFDSVSIKHPSDPKKPNIRLKGFLYETKTYDNPTLKSQYASKIVIEAHSEHLNALGYLSTPNPQTSSYERIQTILEALNQFNTAKAEFIKKRYPVANDNKPDNNPIFPNPIFPNSNPTPPSEWLSIDDVLQVSYDPSKNYTPLDVDWVLDKTMVTDDTKPQSKLLSTNDVDFGM